MAQQPPGPIEISGIERIGLYVCAWQLVESVGAGRGPRDPLRASSGGISARLGRCSRVLVPDRKPVAAMRVVVVAMRSLNLEERRPA